MLTKKNTDSDTYPHAGQGRWVLTLESATGFVGNKEQTGGVWMHNIYFATRKHRVKGTADLQHPWVVLFYMYFCELIATGPH